MSKDIQEAIERIEKHIVADTGNFGTRVRVNDLKTVLNYIENSIPTEVIEKKIKELIDNGYWNFLEERDYEETIEILQDLLENK